MPSAIGSILQRSSRKLGEKLNILTSPTHESAESNWCKTGHNFYAYQHPSVKSWNTKYRPVPSNYTLLDPKLEERQFPLEIEFDCVVAQNKFGQFQLLAPIAKQLHVPLICIEHTLAYDNWPKSYIEQVKTLRGDINIFISEYSREKWGWGKDEATVIRHGVDTHTFSPITTNKNGKLLSICNDYINRVEPCGYDTWLEVIKGFPYEVWGDTPNLSKPTNSVKHLVKVYNEASVFLNTSRFSPIPCVVLEAMSCGLPIVSTDNCMLPEVVDHGITGFLSNNIEELREYCKLLLKDKELAQKMGAAGREKIIKKFSMEKYIENWNKVFEESQKIVFKG